MSTLNVTNLKNITAGVTNVSLLADGSTALVLDSTGTSRLGGIRYNAGNLEVYTSGNVWASVGGGGGGTVTGVTASLPLVSSGGAAPNLTINAATAGALGAVQIGTNLQVTGGGTISILDASDTQKGVVEMATAAEAAAGASATLAAPVAYSVPKDAANMTGAALIPTGTSLQQPTTPVGGMLRMNTDLSPDSLEAYDGTAAAWRQVAYVPNPTLPADLTISANTTLTNSTYVVNNFTVNAGVTATLSSQSVVFICYGDVNIAGTIDANSNGPIGGFTQTGGSFGSFNNVTSGGNIGSGFAGAIAPAGYQPLTSTVGSGGSTGSSETSGIGSVWQGAGSGGGGIIIFSYKNVTISGSLLARGGNGQYLVAIAPYRSTGPGGGSGGSVVVHSVGSITFGGTIDVSGGNGAPGVINGIASPGQNGGGGGGGGYVILQADTTLTNTGTITLTGGAAGAATGAVDTEGGGTGGSFGGRGGQNGGSPGAGAGSIGTFATAGSPI